MSKDVPITLGDRQFAYAHRKVAAGEFGSVSEVIDDALRRAEDNELGQAGSSHHAVRDTAQAYMPEDAKRAWLRREIQKGLDSGPAVEFDIDSWFDEKFGAE